MKTATISPKKLEKERKAWLASVERLADQVESWAKDRHWAVHRENKEVQEPALGVYTVPVIRFLPQPARFSLTRLPDLPVKATAGSTYSRGLLFPGCS